MADNTEVRKAYIELRNHNPVQLFLFAVLVVTFTFLVFENLLPVLQYFLEQYLNGDVINNGTKVRYSIDMPLPIKETSYIFSWAVDIYKDTPQEGRYWFNPVLSIILQSFLISIIITILLTTMLPRNIGYMRHKVDREISGLLEKLAIAQYGYNDSANIANMAEDIIMANPQELRDMVEELGITMDNLEVLRKGLLWQNSSVLYKIIHINDAVKVYMRFYFTVKYSNHVLGFVYIGAAVLIIIIGLRGLKFIPPTQPSLVLFALGLEFSFLVIYALTTMYTKEEDDGSSEIRSESGVGQSQLGADFGSSKEIEKLLRVFIKSKKQ